MPARQALSARTARASGCLRIFLHQFLLPNDDPRLRTAKQFIARNRRYRPQPQGICTVGSCPSPYLAVSMNVPEPRSSTKVVFAACASETTSFNSGSSVKPMILKFDGCARMTMAFAPVIKLLHNPASALCSSCPLPPALASIVYFITSGMRKLLLISRKNLEREMMTRFLFANAERTKPLPRCCCICN